MFRGSCFSWSVYCLIDDTPGSIEIYYDGLLPDDSHHSTSRPTIFWEGHQPGATVLCFEGVT